MECRVRSRRRGVPERGRDAARGRQRRSARRARSALRRTAADRGVQAWPAGRDAAGSSAAARSNGPAPPIRPSTRPARATRSRRACSGLVAGESIDGAIERGAVSASFAIEDWGARGLIGATRERAEQRRKAWFPPARRTRNAAHERTLRHRRGGRRGTRRGSPGGGARDHRGHARPPTTRGRRDGARARGRDPRAGCGARDDRRARRLRPRRASRARSSSVSPAPAPRSST